MDSSEPMFTYVFSGIVIPERAAVAITFDPPVHITCRIPVGANQSLVLETSLAIIASQVSVIAKSERVIEDLWTAHNYIEQMVRSVVDAFGYIEGRGYDVEITSVAGLVDGQSPPSSLFWQVFGVEVGALQASKADRPYSFDEIVPLLFDPPETDGDLPAAVGQQFRRAIGDLREAIRSPHDTGLFCFRAVESIRECFVSTSDADDDHKSSWIRMSQALRISQSWTKDLSVVSTKQ